MPADFAEVRAIVDGSESLDQHTSYTYWVAHMFWPELFLVAEVDSKIVGFTFGLISQHERRAAFLWQVGVEVQHRRRGIAARLIEAFLQVCSGLGVETVRTTISASNRASKSLFSDVAHRNGGALARVGDTGTMCGLMDDEVVYAMPVGPRENP